MRKPLLVAFIVFTGVGAKSCFGIDDPVPQTAEQFCAAAVPDIGRGTTFFCGSSQANLQNAGRFLGYCNVPARSFSGDIGYSGHATNGGIFPVVPGVSEMQAMCNPGAGISLCNGIALCTRDP